MSNHIPFFNDLFHTLRINHCFMSFYDLFFSLYELLGVLGVTKCLYNSHKSNRFISMVTHTLKYYSTIYYFPFSENCKANELFNYTF